MCKLTYRGRMLAAVLIFVVTSGFAILLNGLLRGGINLEFSISKYVGMNTLSAIVFALGNFAVVGLFSGWLYEIGKALKMPKLFYWLVVVMSAALIGLSVFPIGYFDQVPGMSNVPSLMHQLFSRTMFVCMMLMSAWLLLCKETAHKAKIWYALYVIFAMLCAAGFFWQSEWFVRCMLIFESSYLLWFMIMITNLRARGLDNSFIRKEQNE